MDIAISNYNFYVGDGPLDGVEYEFYACCESSNGQRNCERFILFGWLMSPCIEY